MELKEKFYSVLDLHGIDETREIIIRSRTGSLYFIPINRLIEIVSGLYKSQQEIIIQRLDKVEECANQLMDLMYYLAKPLARVRI